MNILIFKVNTKTGDGILRLFKKKLAMWSFSPKNYHFVCGRITENKQNKENLTLSVFIRRVL